MTEYPLSPALTAAMPAPGPLPGLNQTQADPLSELRDIHLPEPVNPWPVAPGWWILLLLILISLVFGIRFLLRRWRSNRYRRNGLIKLQQLQETYARDQDPQQYLLRFSELMKRIALVCFPREQVASLSGEEWVAFLDRTGGTDEFSLGHGQVLMYGTYEPGREFEVQALHELGLKWIKEHRYEWGRSN